MPRPPSIFTVAPGTVVAGRYRLSGLLGRGGMAEVYEGHDLRLERPVAVKLLTPEMAARDDVRTRFQVEAQAAAGLLHPNAVAVYDIGEHDGVPFLVMERLPGETLADRITAGPVDPAWLRTSAVGLLDALAVAHDAGVVHRDVKPGNILLTAEGTAKLGDFGIAKSSGGTQADLTGEGQLLGTPAYLAPERIDGAPATPRSDLWALGVVLYEALGGRKPFAGRGPVEVARAVTDGDHVPLGDLRPDLDPEFVAAVERAMARDPADRFADAREMAAALQGGGMDATVPVASDATLVLTEPAPAPPAPQGRTAGPRWLAWALVAALVLMVLGVLARAGDREPEATGDQATPATTAASTTAPPSTTAAEGPAAALADRLREAASRLDPARDGVRAGDLASGLRQVADKLEAGPPTAAAGNATALAVSAIAWNQAGQLTGTALAGALDLLGQVPGMQMATGGQAPAPTSSAGTSGPSGDFEGSGGSGGSEKGGKGKGKGRGGDD